MSNKIIQLDGSAGGGQMLRSALTLAMITGKPFRMTHIRGKRRKPGLMRQHLTCVQAACKISGGTADGAEIGSTELVFRAGKIIPGNYEFAIGNAGSTSLLLQTLLPALWLAGGSSTVKVLGGTHNPLAPPFDFLDRVYLPALKRMGASANMKLLETGFAPVGGGIVECQIDACDGFKPTDWLYRGELLAQKIRVLLRNLPEEIGNRVLNSAAKNFTCEDAQLEILQSGPGKGVVCYVETQYEHISELTTSFGEFGVSSEKVGNRATKMMSDYIRSGAIVGRHLADQLLLPMAISGAGQFVTLSPDEHVTTHLKVIKLFLETECQIEKTEQGLWHIRLGKG